MSNSGFDKDIDLGGMDFDSDMSFGMDFDSSGVVQPDVVQPDVVQPDDSDDMVRAIAYIQSIEDAAVDKPDLKGLAKTIVDTAQAKVFLLSFTAKDMA